MIILCEAAPLVEELLQQPAVAGTPGALGLDGRDTFENWVVRGKEPESAVLIAARKDTCSFLEYLAYTVNSDHPYRDNGKDKMATSRILTCKVGLKQNVGHLGKEVVVCGLHGYNKTMKLEWPEALDAFCNKLVKTIRLYGVQFLAGDFNMF